MKAMVLSPGASGTTIAEAAIPAPSPSPGQALVEVRASSVNRADLAARTVAPASLAQAAAPAVVGLDAAGVVIDAVGDSRIAPGTRVMTMAAGGLAEQIVVDARLLVPLPEAWSFEDGAASILALLTAHNAIVTAGRLSQGDVVMVHAATSGVGQMAVQMAKQLGAGAVIATIRRRRGEDLLRELGADHVVAVDDGKFADQVLELTAGRGADVVVDHVGGPYLEETVRSAAVKGRVVSVGRLGGATGSLDMEALAFKRLEIVGVTFRTRSPEEKAAVVQAMVADLAPVIATGSLKARIDRVLPWTDVLPAQDLVAEDRHLGKIVLTIG